MSASWGARLGHRMSLLSGLAVVVCGMLLAVAGSASANLVSTFASGFSDPQGLAFDGSGNLYVANAGSGTVSEVTPTGVVSTFATGFSDPVGLAFDGSGNLYVSNDGSNTVSEVTPTGVVSTFATGFSSPFGLAFDASGNLYVANVGSDTVSEVTSAGAVSTFATGFSEPFALAFDGAGNLYVTNANVGTVSEVTPEGVVSLFASGFSDPVGLAFDAAGNLYVTNANNGNNTVSEVTPGGVVSLFASGFAFPVGLAFDAAGYLYVANSFDGTVSVVTGTMAQSITFVKPGPYTYGAAPVTLGATASSDLPVSYTVTNGGPCSVSGSTLTLTGAGSCVVQASQGGNLTYQAATSVSRTIVIDKATPAITWATPADITYGTALSATQLDASTSVPGKLVYTPKAGTVLSAGAGQTLNVTFTPTDTTDYTKATDSVQIHVEKAATTLTATSSDANLFDPIEFSASLTRTDTGAPIKDQTIVFTLGGTTACTAKTNADGIASCSGPIGLLALLRSDSYTASYSGTADYKSSSVTERFVTGR